jgi:hypothetical protein
MTITSRKTCVIQAIGSIKTAAQATELGRLMVQKLAGFTKAAHFLERIDYESAKPLRCHFSLFKDFRCLMTPKVHVLYCWPWSLK